MADAERHRQWEMERHVQEQAERIAVERAGKPKHEPGLVGLQWALVSAFPASFAMVWANVDGPAYTQSLIATVVSAFCLGWGWSKWHYKAYFKAYGEAYRLLRGDGNH
jgi:hypothetical protein